MTACHPNLLDPVGLAVGRAHKVTEWDERLELRSGHVSFVNLPALRPSKATLVAFQGSSKVQRVLQILGEEAVSRCAPIMSPRKNPETGAMMDDMLTGKRKRAWQRKADCEDAIRSRRW